MVSKAYSNCPQEDLNTVYQAERKLNFVNSQLHNIRYEMEYNVENKYYVLNGRDKLDRIVYTGTFVSAYGIFQFLHGMEHLLEGSDIRVN